MNDRPFTRCFALVGTVWTGPLYCGNRAKGTDVNGRPVCGVHKGGQPGIAWFGERYRHPEGTGGEWRFRNGAPR